MLHKAEGMRERGRAIVAVALGGALVAGAMLVLGCGEGSDASHQAPLDVAVATSAIQPVVTPAEAVKPMVASATETKPGEPGTLPPDVEVAVADTLVTPGEPLTIVARATSDATRVELKSDSGDVVPFVRDAGSRTWRVTYRVPLKPVHERWGLSVTARTDSDRWRRVWLFVHVPGAVTPLSVGTDSTGTTPR